MTIHRLLPRDIKRTIELGDGFKFHLLRDGYPTEGTAFTFEHRCKDYPDEDEPDGICEVICAPQLQPGHVPTWEGEAVTISPSILCPECGTHGFVRAGRWEPC